MSYHIPSVGELVVYISPIGQQRSVPVFRVVDAQAGIITFDLDGESAPVRYVDPSGATAYESNSWHYPRDDTSRIGNVALPTEPPKARRAAAPKSTKKCC